MTRTMSAARLLRCGLVLALLSGAGAASAQTPGAFGGFNPSSNQPINIAANQLEVRERDQVAVFSGDVRVTQGESTLRAGELRVFYQQGGSRPDGAAPRQPRPEGQPRPPRPEGEPRPAAAPRAPAVPGGEGAQGIRRLEMSGGVSITSRDQVANAREGVYDAQNSTITLSGNVTLQQGQNIIRGERVVVDLKTGVSRVLAGASTGGRVQGVLVPGQIRDGGGPGGTGGPPGNSNGGSPGAANPTPATAPRPATPAAPPRPANPPPPVRPGT